MCSIVDFQRKKGRFRLLLYSLNKNKKHVRNALHFFFNRCGLTSDHEFTSYIAALWAMVTIGIVPIKVLHIIYHFTLSDSIMETGIFPSYYTKRTQYWNLAGLKVAGTHWSTWPTYRSESKVHMTGNELDFLPASFFVESAISVSHLFRS